MYRRITPRDRQELPLRMLFQPVGDGSFHRACEADRFRGLVAAILDDPAYDAARVQADHLVAHGYALHARPDFLDHRVLGGDPILPLAMR